MSEHPAYRNYWRQKHLRAGPIPHFPAVDWWPDPVGLSPIERIYFNAIKDAPSVLDVGAGDLTMHRKFREAGYRGEYHTQDIGGEFPYDYQDLSEVRRTYGAVVSFDVIEHMPLTEGLTMLDRMVELLDPGGVLIVQTPNSRCIRHPLSWSMTHVQCYNMTDLWSYLVDAGLDVRGYRIPFRAAARRSPATRLRDALSKAVIVKILGSDYADNIAVIARKPASIPTDGTPGASLGG